MPVLHEIIGDKFAELLRAHLPPEDFHEMRERNAARAAGAPPVGHSHDFCDANAVMLDAYAALGLAEPDCRSRAQASLLNSAWSCARAKHLTALADPTAVTLRAALDSGAD